MKWLLALPARLLAPLLLAMLALSTAGLLYLHQVKQYSGAVEAQERLRLTERLALEQTRLEVQSGQGNALQVRRLVTGLGLHQGLTHAWLVGADGRVVASLSRLEQGQLFDTLLARQNPPLRQSVTLSLREAGGQIHIHRIQRMDGKAGLLGHVAIHPDQHLILCVDLAQPLAARLHDGRGEILLEAGVLLGFAVILGLLLHGLWFRRAARLSATAAALGQGDLSARASLLGRDELAQVGASLDAMAARIEAQHGQLIQLADLIGHSPVVAMVWRNLPGWPVAYVSENIRRWGHAPEAFTSGALHYADLIHPEDRPRIDAEVAKHLAHGPDEYTQEYRLRHGDGHWLWLEDRTWLSRDAGGQVMSIQGVLLDVSARKAAEAAQRQLLAQLDSVANASPALLWTSGLDKGCDRFNQTWLEFTGRTLQQELGNGWVEGVHPDDFERCLATYVGAFDARQPFSIEYRLRRHDGEYRWLLDRGMPRYDADGQFIGFIGSCLDVSEEKQTREALREQETFFRLIAENIGDFIAVLDLEGRRLYNSPSYKRFFGVDRELRGSDSFKEIHPDDRESIQVLFQETVRSGIGREANYRLITPDGVIHYMESRGSVIADDAGRPQRVVVVSRDVSERVNMEASLRDSETRYRHLFEHNPAPMLVYERGSLCLLAVNEAFCRHYGYGREEALALLLTDLYPAPEKQPITNLAAGLAGYAYVGEWHHIRKDGSRITIEARSHDIDYQGRYARIVVITDITERKAAEQAVRDSEERLRLALAAASQGLYDLDLSTGDAQVSPEYASMLGYDAATFRETNAAWRDRLHPDDQAAVYQAYEDYVAGRLPEYRVEFRQRTRDGGWKWVLSLGRIQEWSDDGRPLRMLGTHTDIDAIKAAEAALRELNASLEARVAERTAELQALNQSLESFVYSVSHDLKTPLRGIEGYSRLLEADYADRLDDEGRLFIDNIRGGVARMGELIDDLLAYSRMERKTLASAAIDPEPLVRQWLAVRATEITDQAVVTAVELPGVAVLADPDGLAMVLRNLLENALKFSAKAASPRIEIGGRVEQDNVILWVRDNGIGFDMKYHDRIFEIFQRLHRMEDYPGTGIGLALVKKAMQRMGGRVWAESAPGQGATFYLSLHRPTDG